MMYKDESLFCDLGCGGEHRRYGFDDRRLNLKKGYELDMIV